MCFFRCMLNICTVDVHGDRLLFFHIAIIALNDQQEEKFCECSDKDLVESDFDIGMDEIHDERYLL